jgi:HEAT repeat protein
MAESRPPSVVDQLSAAGSFQQLAISKAVQTVGPSAIDLVAAKLKDDASRTNASALLVDLGPSVVPAVLPLLGDSTEAVRLAAVDVLGKLRVEESVPKLIELYEGSKGDEKLGYLSALSSIGDGRAEPLLTAAFRDERLSVPTRSQAALGLGRIGSETSVQLLAQAVDSPDRQLRESVLSGLVLAGDPSLAGSVLPKDVRLVVAGGIDSARADAAIRDALLTQPTVEAADAAIGRPKLASALAQALERTQDGVVLDRLMRALTTTAEGKDRLKAFESHPTLGGLASRRVQIGAG